MFFVPLDRAGPDVTVADEKLAVDVQEEAEEKEKEINIQSLIWPVLIGLSSRFT